MYFDAKDIKSIQGLNKNFELIETITAQNNAVILITILYL